MAEVGSSSNPSYAAVVSRRKISPPVANPKRSYAAVLASRGTQAPVLKTTKALNESCVPNKKEKQSNLFPSTEKVSTHSIVEEPETRPKASEFLNPTQDWTPEKRVSFLREVCETAGRDPRYSNLWHELRKITVCKVIERKGKEENIETWYRKINDNNVINYIEEQQEKCKYDFHSVPDLVRLIRNMRVHYVKLKPDVQRSVGELYKGFDSFFTSRFPNLLLEVYEAAHKCCSKDEYFCLYFTGCSCG